MATVDWLISSRTMATQSITIEGSPTNVTLSAGGAYLTHPTDALSFIAQLEAALLAAGVTTPSVFITEDRHVRITAGSTFTLLWSTATELRDLLGFTATLSGASSYTAPNRSPLLFSPGKIFTPERAPLDAEGQAVADITATVGPQGRIVVREEGEPSIVQTYSARHVPKSRYWAAPPTYSAGEWRSFWETEILTAQRMIVLRLVVEGTSTTASADYSTSTAIGPYRPDMADRSLHRFEFARDTGFEKVEAYYPIKLPVVICDEFTA